LISTFLYSLAGGMLVVLSTGRPGEISWRFLRLVSVLAAATAGSVSVWHLLLDGPTPDGSGRWSNIAFGTGMSLAAAVCAVLARWSAEQPSFFRTLAASGGLFGLTAVSLRTLDICHEHSAARWVAGVAIIGQCLGSAFLGSFTVSWLLGHAYLTATRMTIDPLRRFCRLLSVTVAARIAFASISILLAWQWRKSVDDDVPARLLESWLILTLRIGVGLAAPAIFAYMVSDCVRLRATQSATGILYFASTFAYVGELASLYLISECGWPV